jgi:ADP-ribosylglycohydrolase
MHIPYHRYLDQVLGGWIGKSIGGAIGARFEGNKGWIEISPQDMFPQTLPPNDDLDLQVLWLKVLEEKGPALTSDDLAAAWLEGCWYPFNEYGVFRRNWRLGIHAPYSGRLGNQFWETGMGCPIRSEIWGYIFPGAPDMAARYAEMDGTLDHTEQSVGAEKMLAAMASMAFFVPDVVRLASMFIHHLPKDTPIERLTRAAFECHRLNMPLREARDRLMALGGHPEACDSQINVPFTFLGLLYGGNDLENTLLQTLRCGYDTDCTMATAAALLGQILGASRIPESLKGPIGDQLVMGIECRRPEMTLSALARDTARIGVLMAGRCATGVTVADASPMAPLPESATPAATSLRVDYESLPAAAPAEAVRIALRIEGQLPPAGTPLSIQTPPGWGAQPATIDTDGHSRVYGCTLHAPAAPARWPMRNIFTAALGRHASLSFGVCGAQVWKLVGVFYDALPDESDPIQRRRRWQHHFASLAKPYLPEPVVPVRQQYDAWSRILGRPALVPSYQREIDPTRLIGLRGEYCAYLAATFISQRQRTAYMMIGNTDGYRIYLNDELVAQADEHAWWTPRNNVVPISLGQGENRFLLKLLKRGDDFRFTMDFRADEAPPPRDNANCNDFIIDLEQATDR